MVRRYLDGITRGRLHYDGGARAAGQTYQLSAGCSPKHAR